MRNAPRPNSTEVVGAATIYVHRVLARNKALIAICMVTCLAVGGLFLAKTKPLYESTAQLLLMKDYGVLANASAMGGGIYGNILSDDMLSTQVVLLTSKRIVERAVKDGDLRSLAQLRLMSRNYENDLVVCIQDNLRVTRGGEDRTLRDASVMNIAFRAYDPYEAREVLGEILTAYENFLKESTNKDTDQTRQDLQVAKNSLDTGQKVIEQQVADFLKQAPVFWQSANGEFDSLARRTMVDLLAAETATEIRLKDLESQLKTIEDARLAGATPESLLKTIASTRPDSVLVDRAIEAKDPFLSALQSGYVNAIQRRTELLTRYDQKHSLVKAADAAVKKIEEILQEVNLEDRAFEVHESTPEAKLQASIDSLKQQIKMTRSHAEQLKAELTELEQKSKDMAVTQLKYETLLNERLNSNKLFDAVVGRLREVTIVKTDNHGFRATQIAPPTEGEHVYPKTIVVLAVSLMAGVVFGLSLGTLKELSQTRLATVEDVRALARGMGVWRVNRLDLKELKPTSPDTRIDETLVAFHYPNSPHAECFRGIRTSLYFHARTKEQQVFQITSSRPGEGKTTISGNLAVSLAQTGKKVLLVDADLRRSRVHHLFGIQDGLGITDMIEDGAGFTECCHTTEQDGLLILPRGSRTERPSELLMSPRFQNVLKEARSQFDFIIVDSPPLLAVSDASHVSGYVDAMILVVSLEGARRKMLTDSLELLDSFDSEISAVVVNFVGGSEQGYYGYQYDYQEAAATS